MPEPVLLPHGGGKIAQEGCQRIAVAATDDVRAKNLEIATKMTPMDTAGVK